MTTNSPSAVIHRSHHDIGYEYYNISAMNLSLPPSSSLFGFLVCPFVAANAYKGRDPVCFDLYSLLSEDVDEMHGMNNVDLASAFPRVSYCLD